MAWLCSKTILPSSGFAQGALRADPAVSRDNEVAGKSFADARRIGRRGLFRAGKGILPPAASYTVRSRPRAALASCISAGPYFRTAPIP
jgi:hypothetical protein